LGVIKKQAFQSSVLIYVGTVLGFLTAGIIAPNLLSESQIGTLRLLLSYSGIFANLGILGFTTVTIRFFHHFYDKNTDKSSGFLGIAMIVGTLGASIAILLISIIRPDIIENNIGKSPEFARYFYLIIPLAVFQTFYSLFDSYNNARYRSSLGIFLRDFVQRILMLVGLSLVFFHIFTFESYTYYFAFAICLPTILILLDIVRNGAFDVKVDFRRFGAMLRPMLGVGFYGMLNSLSVVAALQIDSIMINSYLNTAAVGIYTTAFYFGTLVFVPSKALNKIAPTLISKGFKEDDLATVKDIYYRSCKNLFIIGTLVWLGLLVNLENIFQIIPKSYFEGKWVIVIIGLASLIKMAGGSNDSVITYSKYFRVTTLFLLIYLGLIVLSNWLFIPQWGITGAALATLVAILLYNLLKFIFIKIKFGFNPYSYQYLLILSIAALLFVVIRAIPDPDNFIADIILDSTLTTVLFYIAIRRLPLSADLEDSGREILKSLWHYFKTKR
jgi:O-antigen/teichoic acid export membrane protein